MHKFSAAILVAGLGLLGGSGCQGLKDAIGSRGDIVARAGSQELPVQRLAGIMAKAQVPIQKEVARQIADLWVSYQLLGHAAAVGDSLSDPKVIDEAMWPVYTQSRTQKWYEVISKTWKVDTTDLEKRYNEGKLLSARHILFQVPQGIPGVEDSIRRQAESVLRQTTSANFAAMAKRYGSDATKDQGGDLGVFAPAQMVPEFAQAVAALQPGQIGPLVKTQFGYHIVRRNTYAEVKDQFRAQWESHQRREQESLYVDGVEKAAKIQVRPNLAKVVKQVAAEPDEHKNDRTVVATSTLGDFTAAQVARWISGFSQPEQVRSQIQQAPDSLLPVFVKNLIRNELFLRQADSAKIELDSSEIASVRQAFRSLVINSWAGLGVSPGALADSAKSDDERRKLAAARVERYLDRLLGQEVGFVEVPAPLAVALRERYSARVYATGLDRAVEAAQRLRASEDSARASQQPPSAVPMPGPGSRGK
ncbi:MAG TPA: peptidylprolyl isomerase [Gemmatimonadaceae bacterium]|nr:peptidylprolyl isomerase [Gemmatimonadaceae bacterium]